MSLDKGRPKFRDKDIVYAFMQRVFGFIPRTPLCPFHHASNFKNTPSSFAVTSFTYILMLAFSTRTTVFFSILLSPTHLNVRSSLSNIPISPPPYPVWYFEEVIFMLPTPLTVIFFPQLPMYINVSIWLAPFPCIDSLLKMKQPWWYWFKSKSVTATKYYNTRP